jgi:hypothetical protein
MSTTLGFSEINNTDSTNNTSSKKNQTRKRNHSNTLVSKAQRFLNSMKNNNDIDKGGGVERSDSEGASLADFVPNPILTRTPDAPTPLKHPGSELLGDDTAVEQEDFKLLNRNQSNGDYYKQFIKPKMDQYNRQYSPYYDSLRGEPQLGAVTDPNELMKKLNYMIHLLEEQQDEKTENVTEELILYLFLGVFVIFVVDSFARAGKYTR